MKNRTIYIGIVLLTVSIIIAGCIGKEQTTKVEPTIEPTVEPTDTIIPTSTPTVISTSAIPVVSTQINKTNSTELIYVNTTYIRFDDFYGVHILSVNVSTKESGHLIYLENYYNVDSHRKPNFYTTEKFYDNSISIDKPLNIEIHRPKDRRGSAYSLVEKVFILNGKRTTTWMDLHKYW